MDPFRRGGPTMMQEEGPRGARLLPGGAIAMGRLLGTPSGLRHLIGEVR